MEVRWKSPRHGKTINCFECSEWTTSSQLLVCECRWSSDLGGGCQFEPFGDGYWPPDIGLGVQPYVLGSLWSTRGATLSGGGDIECGTSDNGDTIFSDESWFSLYHSDGRVRMRRSQGKRLIDAGIQPNDGNHGPAGMVWCAIHPGEWVSWSWWMEPWTSIVTSRYWGIKCCHGRWRCLNVTLCTSKTMPRPIQHVTRQPFWTNRMLRPWTGQLGVQTWTQLSTLGIKCQSASQLKGVLFPEICSVDQLQHGTETHSGLFAPLLLSSESSILLPLCSTPTG